MIRPPPPLTAPSLQDLPAIRADEPGIRGRICVLESGADLPFEIRRVYWIHGMARGERRGGHAHRALVQAMVAVSGQVEMELDDGHVRQRFVLDTPDRMLLVPPGFWRDFTTLQDGTTLMVLASQPYREDDYIRDRAAFLAHVAQPPPPTA